MMDRTPPPRPETARFTGRHMAAILVGFFAVVVGVNLFMARMATGTFGGVVVENSYVASQHFNRWLDRAAQARALGWQASAVRLGDGRVAVMLAGVAGADARLTGDAWHPLGRLPDRPLAFALAPDGRFVSREALPQGRWRLRLEVRQGGRSWRTEQDLR